MPRIPIDCEREGEAGRGGNLDDKPVDDRLVVERLAACERLGEASWPSLPSAGDTGLLATADLLDAVPLNRALLDEIVSF